MTLAAAAETLDAPAVELSRLRYALGFLLSSQPDPQRPAWWTRRPLDGWSLWHDPKLPYAEADCPAGLVRRRTSLACLGVILDAERPEGGSRAALDRLARALRRSEGAFLAALDTMAGRHVLIYRIGGRTHVVGDAVGTKQVFRYHREAIHLASHVRLIGRNGAEARREPIDFGFGHPGLDTDYRNVHLLTPNTRLRVEDGDVRRFWPRRRLRPAGVVDAAEEVATLMRATLRGLARDHRLAVSVTAGLDSRVTLSLVRDLEPNLFTFWRTDGVASDGHDLAFAETCRCSLDLDVRVFRIREMSMPKRFHQILAKNTPRQHVRGLTWALLTQFPRDEPWLHVRSNVSEVGRQFYGAASFSDPPRAADLARLQLARREKMSAPDVFAAIDRFERYAETTGILRCARRVDLSSLFYWEHRMPSWFANTLTESDVGMDTVSPFNCRRALEAMLRVPLADRRSSAVHRHIVAARAPDLTRYPVNGRTLWT